jgi:hypothetical protein
VIIQVKKRSDGRIELMHRDITIAVLTREQAKTLADVLIAATNSQ